MKVVGLIGRGGGRIAPAALSNVDTLMRVSGGNIGNFAFWTGARSILGPATRNLAARLPVPRDLGGLVIPAANWLNTVSDFGWLADFVEAANVPTVILGLGAQSDTDRHYPSIPSGTLRLLRAVASRSPFLGVRGEYTAGMCRRLGIANVRVLGCPSIFLNPSPQLGRVIERNWQTNCARIATHGFSARPRAEAAERFLFSLVRRSPGAVFIVQAPREILALCIDERATLAEAVRPSATRFAPDVGADEFVRIVRERAYIPPSIEAWLGRLSTCTHTLNTRIHGSLMSLAAERPAVCFVHDTRTAELCATLQVPAVEAESMARECSAESIFRSTLFDGASFDANRARLAREHQALLHEVGIQTSETLDALADA